MLYSSVKAVLYFKIASQMVLHDRELREVRRQLAHSDVGVGCVHWVIQLLVCRRDPNPQIRITDVRQEVERLLEMSEGFNGLPKCQVAVRLTPSNLIYQGALYRSILIIFQG